jgi:hypothetical protein
MANLGRPTRRHRCPGGRLRNRRARPNDRARPVGRVARAGPVRLGLKGIVAAIRTRDQDQPPIPAVATGLLSVVGVTIANGADNISVYTPVSHHRPDQQRSHRGRVRRRNRRLVPSRVLAWLPQKDHWGDTTVRALDCASVFMLIGAVIIIESRVLGRPCQRVSMTATRAVKSPTHAGRRGRARHGQPPGAQGWPGPCPSS